MQSRGMNHFGLVTHDIDGTIDFYRDVLGFEPVAYYLRELAEGHIRQVFFDLGSGQTLEFAQFHDIDAVSDDYDAGINDGVGVGKVTFGVGPIHFAFHVDSLEELEERKKRLEEASVQVLGPIDLDWVHSIYFCDPNGVQLEFAHTARETPGDAYLEPIATEKWQQLKAETAARQD